MFSLAVWRVSWWKEKIQHITFYFGLYLILSSGGNPLQVFIGLLIIGFNDDVIRKVINHFAPSFNKLIDGVADTAKEAMKDL